MNSRRFSVALIFVLLLAVGAVAQEGPKSSLSMNFGATFTQNNGSQPSGNAAYTVSFDHQFTAHSGLVVNYSNLQDQKFASPEGGVQSTITEATMGYVGRMNFHKLSPFFVVGGGALIFSPGNNFVLASGGFPSTQTRAALLYGAGTDYNFSKHLAVRMQYRGLLYPSPSFHTIDMDNGSKAHTAQTMLGVVFRF